MAVQKRAEFVRLFQEFASAYPYTPDGLRHIAAYDEQRRQGHRNFAAIATAAEFGEDVTEAVLLQLLPHTNSPANRRKGAWIHCAGCITEDLQSTFKKLGWTEPENWPLIASKILYFVRRCSGDPSQLSAACSEFLALPYSKGFSMGMLAPILNALRPDEFLLLNNKSRQTLNYFANTSYTQKLTDYPEANDTGQQLVKELAREMHLLGVPALRDDDLFDMFSHWLVTIKKRGLNGTRYWKIAPSETVRQWEEWREDGSIAIGWDDLGDISSLSKSEFDKRRDQLIAQHPEWQGKKSGVNQVWVFAHIQERDRIVANRGTTEVLGIGTVTGSYYFVPNVRHGHRLPVQWDDFTPRRVNESGWNRTLMEIGREKFEEIVSIPDRDSSKTTPTLKEAVPHSSSPHVFDPKENRNNENKKLNPEYSLSQCALDTGFEQETLARWVRAIERKGQAILYGSPGTGKTFIAERLCRHLTGGSDGCWELVQFHPAYAYEDFIQGIRPQAGTNGQLNYPLVPGRFLEFCQKAQFRQDKCVLIVDEINRANLAQVFGELMYLLEYRDRSIPLAGGNTFCIPANVRIIGTMNTADRSIALVDHALRRRFAFLELRPNYEVLRRYHQKTGFPVEGLIETLERLNQAIADKHYEVGISFFLNDRLAEQIEDIWCMEIEPYIDEYFFSQPDKVNEFCWDRIGTTILT